MKFSATFLTLLCLSLAPSSSAFTATPAPIRSAVTQLGSTTMDAPTSTRTKSTEVQSLMAENQATIDKLGDIAPELSAMERLRFALQFDTLADAQKALRERQAWSRGKGAGIVASARSAVEQATAADGGWDNAPVYAAAPHATVINQYITPKSVMTLSTDDGDLVYVIRASAINDKELMNRVSVNQVGDYFLYAKEVHSLVANRRSETTGRFARVIFANDISGVRKPPDARFSKALTSSSDQYEVLYPSLAGPTMILNLPFVLQAFVGLLKPLFPKSVQERLVFTKAPVLAGLKELTPLANSALVRQKFVREVKSLLPQKK